MSLPQILAINYTIWAVEMIVYDFLFSAVAIRIKRFICKALQEEAIREGN